MKVDGECCDSVQMAAEQRPPSISTPRCPHRHGIEPAEAVGCVGAVVTFPPLLRVVSLKGGRLVLRRGVDGREATPPSAPTPLVAHTAIESLTITHHQEQNRPQLKLLNQ